MNQLGYQGSGPRIGQEVPLSLGRPVVGGDDLAFFGYLGCHCGFAPGLSIEGTDSPTPGRTLHNSISYTGGRL